MSTIVAVFRHSGDADLAALHLLEEMGLTEAQVEVIAPTDSSRLVGALDRDQTYGGLSGFEAAGTAGPDPIAKRWGAEVVYGGKTLVVAQPSDPADPFVLAEALHRSGAELVDLLME